MLRKQRQPGARSKPNPKLFVIMPFGRFVPVRQDDTRIGCDYDQWYAEIMKPAAEPAGLDVTRGDSSLVSMPIMQQVLLGIRDADMVLAFLTNLNPNVMHELGVAHALRRPVLPIAEKSQKRPFDVAHLRHYLYDDMTLNRVKAFKPEITRRLKAVAAAPQQAVLGFKRRNIFLRRPTSSE